MSPFKFCNFSPVVFMQKNLHIPYGIQVLHLYLKLNAFCIITSRCTKAVKRNKKC